jgi:DNA adenine methylase
MLFYLDPPYLHETRVSTADYDFEMSTDQHVELLEAIDQCAGNVLLSGYPNKLYNESLTERPLHTICGRKAKETS